MSPTLPSWVVLNGRLVRGSRARISAFDRGFLFGDGAFETLRSYRGRLPLWEGHAGRWEKSATRLGIALPRRPWRQLVLDLLEACGLQNEDASVRLTVSRGAGWPALAVPAEIEPTTLIHALPIPAAVVEGQRRGIAAVLVPFSRAGAVPDLKRLDYVPALLARERAAAAGAREALYVDRGRVTEGATCNLFALVAGEWVTPPRGSLLPGLTRDRLLRLGRESGFSVVERSLPVATLAQAEEIFVCSSLAEVTPLVRLDGQPVGSGRPGPATRKWQRCFRLWVRHQGGVLLPQRETPF